MNDSRPASEPSPDQPATPDRPVPAPAGSPRNDGSCRDIVRKWCVRLLGLALLISLISNLVMYWMSQPYFASARPPQERFHSGEKSADEKIAIVTISGTIMPPFTDSQLRAIRRAREDEAVKGVLLVVDSPGGFVADSHQIYHELERLRAVKPVYVAMKRIAASGGLYVAMGAGPEGVIYAEPTTWTGSIGVIVPRYDLQGLADKVGVEFKPLKTGPLKDALSPFRELTDREREVWETIIDDSFGRFVSVIAGNRPELDESEVRALATGQIYTADQALENHLVDRIGFQHEALDALQKKLGLESARIVTYYHPPSLLELLAGSVEAQQPAATWNDLLEATVPRAMYFCSWGAGAPLP